MVLDELWEQSSQLSDEYSIEFHKGEIALVKNIFKYPEMVLKFQKLLSVWESTGSAKPGLMFNSLYKKPKQYENATKEMTGMLRISTL